jgi:hypothetical protein
MRIRLQRGWLVATLTVTAVATVVPANANTPNFTPYRHPTYHCATVHRYGNGVAPNPLTLKDDPLCVVYNKRDITADNGGAIRFTLAEPARFAVAGKCQYWQRDHWKIRLDRGYGKLVQWDGSYWWDLKGGYAGAILRNFRIAGQPVGPYQAAAVISSISPPLAAQIRKYGAGPGGGFGASVTLPSGIGC